MYHTGSKNATKGDVVDAVLRQTQVAGAATYELGSRDGGSVLYGHTQKFKTFWCADPKTYLENLPYALDATAPM